MPNLEDYCSVPRQDFIVKQLDKGDITMAQIAYEHCRHAIHDQNPDLMTVKALDKKGASEGNTSQEIVLRMEKEKSGNLEVADLYVELLNEIKDQQYLDGLCTIDFDDNGNPFAGDYKISCMRVVGP